MNIVKLTAALNTIILATVYNIYMHVWEKCSSGDLLKKYLENHPKNTFFALLFGDRNRSCCCSYSKPQHTKIRLNLKVLAQALDCSRFNDLVMKELFSLVDR